MEPRRRWYDGTSDPLDQRKIQHGEWVKDDLDPRRPVSDQVVTEASAVTESKDPLDILIECEDADEAEGCQCGKHLSEYYRRFHSSTQSTTKGKS